MANYKVKQVLLEDLGPAVRVLQSSSSSRPGLYHYTFVWGDRTPTCSCEGYVHHGHCKHIDNLPASGDSVDLLANTDGLSDEEDYTDPFEGLSDAT